jgi:hypothetical protein
MYPRYITALYRRYAEYCVEIAQDATDSGRRAAFLSMAQAWRTLAEHVEKGGDTPTRTLPVGGRRQR